MREVKRTCHTKSSRLSAATCKLPLHMDTLAGRIKKRMEALKIKAPAVAKGAGTTRQSVYLWLRGDTKSLKGGTLLGLARTLRTNPDWLATGKGDPEDERAAPPPDLSPEALHLARKWMQLSPGRRAKFLEEISWATFFEGKFPPYRIGIANVASHDKFERSVEADWEKMMRQAKLFEER